MAIKLDLEDIDLKDRKILYELDVDSRQSNAEIARKVGLSKQVVGFRIKRLVKEGLISWFYSIFDINNAIKPADQTFLD